MSEADETFFPSIPQRHLQIFRQPRDLVYPQLLGSSRFFSRATYTSCLRFSVCEISPLARYERSCLTSLDRKTILMTWGTEAAVLELGTGSTVPH